LVATHQPHQQAQENDENNETLHGRKFSSSRFDVIWPN
jgi:hypothetical protein